MNITRLVALVDAVYIAPVVQFFLAGGRLQLQGDIVLLRVLEIQGMDRDETADIGLAVRKGIKCLPLLSAGLTEHRIFPQFVGRVHRNIIIIRPRPRQGQPAAGLRAAISRLGPIANPQFL